MQLNSVFINWLLTNKITEEVQRDFDIQFNEHIIIPVYDVDGVFSFNKYRRSPLKDNGPKYWYDKGGKVTLYGYHKAKLHDTILITEGEKDCLVAWSHNIPAVSSTGGAQSFQKEWASLFDNKQVVICYDNDPAGAEGLVKTLGIIPHAKVLLLPDLPNVKDISDYVNNGGNLHELLKTARHFEGLAEIKEDQSKRLALYQSTHFHERYIKEHTKVAPNVTRRSFSSDEVTNAKLYPIPALMGFTNNKARCPFHAERTPSFHYFPEDNHCYCFGGCGRAFDVIDIYRKLHNCTFKEAVTNLNKMV